jgi:cytoskeletal protein CcmA (bactofilin family)
LIGSSYLRGCSGKELSRPAGVRGRKRFRREERMFKKKAADGESIGMDSTDNRQGEEVREKPGNKRTGNKMDQGKSNMILKGSKVTGDINVSCDLELSGDVEGNITSKDNSNIAIKGTCKGNIDGGNVNIEGELRGGNITAGNDVRISGKFSGGEVHAKGRIYVNGEFSGKLEANEIEIGANARGDGELYYKESISIAKGARIEARISQIQQELQLAKDPAEKPVAAVRSPEKELKKAESA